MHPKKQSVQLLPRLLTVALAAALWLPAAASAHAVGEDYVFFNFRESSLDGLFEVHFDELREELGLDLPEDEEAARQQLRASAERVQRFILDNFSIGPVGGEPYALRFTGTDLISLPQGTFAQYRFEADTGPLPDQLAVSHRMFHGDDRLHRGLLLIEYNQKTETTYPGEYTAMVFGPSNPEQVLDLTDVPGLIPPRDMVWQGVLHIWIGIDHILFLLALLLPTVLRREENRWQPVERFSQALWNLLKIVTVFTIAHSVTLLLAALGYIDLPSRLVESVIALSIVLVAVNNITGTVRDGSLTIVLVLGLFHGLGFASVMGHLPFRVVDLLRSVVAFNIGVELGQIAIVLVIFPILYLLRERDLYRPLVLQGASAVLILIAGWWFVQRAFALG
ncbi:MAG: HupE/UreJ family protein [Acidobacteria bacterium]|nr:MAG: HupE/UreJ family protein [Acidobacteriota bacterium]REK08745.1 MAG: HupE/UreJ family protein [Acidobacteriota bacterium]